MKIQIVMTYSGDLLGRLMRWWGLTWSHALIRYHEDWMPDGVWRLYETAASGTVEKPWSGYLDKVKEWKIMETVVPLRHMQMMKILSFCAGAEGKPYNYFKLLGIALEFLLRERKPQALAVRSYVCSSFVAALFEHIGIDLVPNWQDIWVTPDDIAKSLLLKEVGENEKRIS